MNVNYKFLIRDLASAFQTRDGCIKKKDNALKVNVKSEYKSLKMEINVFFVNLHILFRSLSFLVLAKFNYLFLDPSPICDFYGISVCRLEKYI